MNTAKRVGLAVLGVASGVLGFLFLFELVSAARELAFDWKPWRIVDTTVLVFFAFAALGICFVLLKRVVQKKLSQSTTISMKVIGWTLGMAAGVVLITDGKAVGKEAGEHALIGALVGLVLGCLFAWKQRNNLRV